MPEYETCRQALDYVRLGWFYNAVEQLGIQPGSVQAAMLESLSGTIPDYEGDPEAFLARLRFCAERLESVGL